MYLKSQSLTVKNVKMVNFTLRMCVCQRRQWHPTPVLLPGKSHGQRIPVGYSPWSHKMVRQDLLTKQQPSYFHPYKEKNVTSLLRMSWVRSNLSPVFSVSCTCGRAPNSECRVCLKKWRVQALGQTHLEFSLSNS